MKVFRRFTRHPHRQRAADRPAILYMFPRDGQTSQICPVLPARLLQPNLRPREIGDDWDDGRADTGEISVGSLRDQESQGAPVRRGSIGKFPVFF